jgi:phytoene dehydrogenase-like protein
MHASPFVIIAAGPADVSALVEKSDETVLSEWAKTAIPVKAACLDIALNYLPQPGANFALGIDQHLYLSVHSATADLAPAGGAVIQVAKYLGSGDNQDPKRDEKELEQMLDLIQPGWREALADRRYLPSMTVSHALTTAAQGGFCGRPGPAAPEIDGLYVAGDWVGAEGMLADASLASAKSAAQMILSKARGRAAAAA